jgi:hypothetical protein
MSKDNSFIHHKVAFLPIKNKVSFFTPLQNFIKIVFLKHMTVGEAPTVYFSIIIRKRMQSYSRGYKRYQEQVGEESRG